MSVLVRFRGRLGNNLFQYALGRIVATHRGLAMTCYRSSIPSQRLARSATLEALSSAFPGAPLSLTGHSVRSPTVICEVGKGGWSGQSIDLRSLLASSAEHRIVLDGYFQRYEYYAPYLDKIRGWFATKGTAGSGLCVSDRDVLISVRRGADFEAEGWCLPASYYLEALQTMSDISTVYVCGVGDTTSILDALQAYHPICVSGSALDHFTLMQRFRRVVLSNSTFAWWSALLSDAEDICAPRFECSGAYSFSGFQDVDLHMRSQRYREIPVRSPACSEARSRSQGI